jgi:hypothetical protein
MRRHRVNLLSRDQPSRASGFGYCPRAEALEARFSNSESLQGENSYLFGRTIEFFEYTHVYHYKTILNEEYRMMGPNVALRGESTAAVTFLVNSYQLAY